jgi:hypothetical protein
VCPRSAGVGSGVFHPSCWSFAYPFRSWNFSPLALVRSRSFPVGLSSPFSLSLNAESVRFGSFLLDHVTVGPLCSLKYMTYWCALETWLFTDQIRVEGRLLYRNYIGPFHSGLSHRRRARGLLFSSSFWTRIFHFFISDGYYIVR